MSQFRPYWHRHPHQLRVFAFVMLFLAPLLVPVLGLLGIWQARWDIWDAIRDTYSELWEGVTHRLPSKPILRPAARVLSIVLPYAAIILAFNYAAPHASVCMLVVLYGGLALLDIAVRSHEREKADEDANWERKQFDREIASLNWQLIAMKACST